MSRRYSTGKDLSMALGAVGAADSSSLLEKIGDFLECQICLDNYKRPKVLQCLHTFCEECLMQMAPDGVRAVVCPTCREETILNGEGVTDLKNNFVFANLLDLVTSIQKPLDEHFASSASDAAAQYGCTNCDSGSLATTRCLNCCEFMCADCTDAHRRIKAIRHHVMRDIEDWLAAGRHIIAAGKAEERAKNNSCLNHEEDDEQPVEVYCEACETAVCKMCGQTDHLRSPHRVVPMQEAAERGRNQIKHILNQYKRKLSVFSTAIEATVQTAKDLQRKSDRAQQDIQQTARDYTSRIQNEQSELMALLHKKREGKESEMAAHINSLQRAVDILRGMCSMAENALGDTCSPVDVLRSKVKLSGSRRELNQLTIVSVPSDLSKLKFRKNSDFTFPDNVLGKLDD